eukprot:CAMPEP_0168717948 /NCGR_PEP_ID=MMETSP0724-20121128/261_1 /TAXON_ID=265536 /ORGANISM="Amphiprora sp., Strain CCMP467" /LENGTH=1003 /DNA_ID=CAMNT_0008764437 /DNA_START=689 /DNA_END=3700 /DNA_ORIENTATION=+
MTSDAFTHNSSDDEEDEKEQVVNVDLEEGTAPIDKETTTATTTTDKKKKKNQAVVHIISDIQQYKGATLQDKVNDLIHSHGIVMFSKTFCPFCLDLKELLTNVKGVPVYSLEVNDVPQKQGTEIHTIVKDQTGHKTVPAVYIHGIFRGGCDDVKGLQTKNELDALLQDLVVVDPPVQNVDRLETARLVPPQQQRRGEAVRLPFWFPPQANDYVVRITSFQVVIVCVILLAFHWESWAKWVSAALLVDFGLRTTVGSSLSPLGMMGVVATATREPQLVAGAGKQFAASIGTVFTAASTACFFAGHDIAAMVILGVLLIFAALESCFGYCAACHCFMIGIQWGLLPNSVYRIYTSARQELMDTWNYVHANQDVPTPERVDTDPTSKIALKYKTKTDEFTKNDFDWIRHMMPCYFAIPLSLAGLATAFKLGSEYMDPFRGPTVNPDLILVPEGWYQVLGVISAVLFALFAVLFACRLIQYPKKCRAEWVCPQRSPSFGAITITVMLLAFLLHDEIRDGPEEWPQKTGRIVFWIAAVAHALLTVVKFSEWVGFRHEFEHVHPQWLIFPVGLAVASFGVVMPFFEETNAHFQEANVLLARFFLSFGYLLWIAIFSISLFKVVTGHNSDPRARHGVWIWMASPCIIGIADFATCAKESALGYGDYNVCVRDFSSYFFIGVFFFFTYVWMSLPYIGFFGRDPFNKGYWIDSFCMDCLACAAAVFYALHNTLEACRTIAFIIYAIAGTFNCVAFLHTLKALAVHRGFFTPMDKWGPLSWFKLTHEAFRGSIPKLKKALAAIDLTQPTGQRQLELFAANYSTFVRVHQEHSKHEDKVIFKTFNDLFPGHCKEYFQDHEDDRVFMEEKRVMANKVLDTTLSLHERQTILRQLQHDLPVFFDEFLVHIRGEEDNMQPIGKKYMPLELQKQMARACFQLTPAERWEEYIPFVINNAPRHPQRVRFIKSMCWSMPERAQQLGAIVYRNVDAVMWKRMDVEIPEMIPRGESNWRKYQ